MNLKPSTDREFSIDDAILQDRWSQLSDAQSTIVRSLAKQWADGLRGLIALVGAIGFVGAPLASDRLSPTAWMISGIAILVILAVSLTGFLLMMRSAYGRTARIHRPGSDREYREIRQTGAHSSLKDLKWGRGLAVGSLGALIILIGLVWFDPWSDRFTTKSVITSPNGTSLCIEQIFVNGDPRFTDWQALMVEPDDHLEAIYDSESCPSP